jgi:S1-C subfamily serine protease
VGWFYKCTRCTRWHFNLAGGYAITVDGAVATCHHVVEPGDTMKEGYLIAVTVDGEVLPVGEVLAANKLTDACIVRVRSEQPLKPLAVNTEIQPGDEVWCYSDPAGREGYFSRGMVNRFFRHVHGDEEAPVRINVSTDWAPGSSGSAVLDVFGNAIGHVTAIDSHGGGNGAGTDDHAEKTLIVFHSAVRASDVRSLIGRAD